MRAGNDGILRVSSQAVCAATLVLLLADMASSGWIEAREDGTTVIHVKLSPDVLPDPSKPDTSSQAEAAAVREFEKNRFAKIFAQKYRDKYKANPAKYGKSNWDKVEIRLDRATGIKVEGVENDLLAIAGGVAPDVIYVNFRKSDTYIRNRFLYPLDEYLGDLSKARTTDKAIARPGVPPNNSVVAIS